MSGQIHVLTGKALTFSFDEHDGTAQVTSGSTTETDAFFEAETLGGEHVEPLTASFEAEFEFLFDAHAPQAGLYEAVQAAKVAKRAGALSIDGGGASLTGTAYVASVATKIGPKDATACTVKLRGVGELSSTPAARPAAAVAKAKTPATANE